MSLLMTSSGPGYYHLYIGTDVILQRREEEGEEREEEIST